MWSSQWNLHTPEVLFSVTGGADLDLTPRQMMVFKRGFSQAANTVDSWVISGGSDAGVMRLVGNALGDRGMRGSVPVIGIATFHKVKGKHLFADVQGTNVLYDTAAVRADDGAFLNPDHTVWNRFAVVWLDTCSTSLSLTHATHPVFHFCGRPRRKRPGMETKLGPGSALPHSVRVVVGRNCC